MAEVLNTKVFVPQIPHTLNRKSGTLEPKFDLLPAEEFGEVIALVGPNAKPNQQVIDQMCEKLTQEWVPGSFLLLMGNPVLMGVLAAQATTLTNIDDPVKYLQWSGKTNSYEVVEAMMPEIDF